MLKYVIKRLLWMIPVLLGVLVIVFVISYFTPGDPILTILGQDFSQEAYDYYQQKLGLDKPFLEQLVNYIWKIVTRLDFGVAITTGLDVKGELLSKFPTTIKLGLMTVALTAILGIPIGIVASTKQYSVIDYTVTAVSVILAAVPGFVLALIMLIVFSLHLRWLPMGGIKEWKSWILPVLSGALPFVATIARMTRTSMLEVVRQDYIRTARSKGLKENYIISKHALPNALIPIITSLGIQLGHIAGGALIIETIYAIPGMGLYMYSGISSRDYYVINGCVLLISVFVSVMNLLVDLAYAFIDPRVKAQYASKKSKKPAKEKKAVAAEA